MLLRFRLICSFRFASDVEQDKDYNSVLQKWKNEVIHKDKLVTEAVQLSQFIINLQFERAKVCLAVFLDVRSGKATDLSTEYAKTDATLQMIKWRKFGH